MGSARVFYIEHNTGFVKFNYSRIVKTLNQEIGPEVFVIISAKNLFELDQLTTRTDQWVPILKVFEKMRGFSASKLNILVLEHPEYTLLHGKEDSVKVWQVCKTLAGYCARPLRTASRKVTEAFLRQD